MAKIKLSEDVANATVSDILDFYEIDKNNYDNYKNLLKLS